MVIENGIPQDEVPCLTEQPDVCHAGGIAECRRIASQAETYSIRVAPHNPNGPVATAASVHLAATIPNSLILESAIGHPFLDESQAVGLEINQGWIELPRRTGVGVELDHAAVTRHPYAAMHDRVVHYSMARSPISSPGAL
ncbi:MAG: hypothetical protein EPO26_10685 [Chloroflexota bacterium]|nr:MAG: hypothetical protein EPO26_10685 [Chloroflexota bacterium]